MAKKKIMYFISFAMLISCRVFSAAGGKIQDNSFLMEEAYNQEAGVMQHIQSYQYLRESKNWAYSFTEEWPAPAQTHQLSITVPVNYINASVSQTGLGDISLNYRYQLLNTAQVALAPRVSLLYPSGDYKKGFGAGAAGVQINLPLSVELSEKWVTHWNMGATVTPGSKSPGTDKSDTFGFNSGVSFIRLVTENFNIMLETVWNSYETVGAGGTKSRSDTLFINPGLRFALNFKSGLQIVPGISFPVGMGPSAGETGMLVYLSFEHPVF